MILVPSTANATSSSTATVVTNAVSGQPIVTPAVSSLPIPTNGCEFKIDMIEKQITKIADMKSRNCHQYHLGLSAKMWNNIVQNVIKKTFN